MRLRAVQEIFYAGRQIAPGMLFDALEDDGRNFVTRNIAIPFNLEDPFTRPLDVILEQNQPPELPPPNVPEPSLDPSSLNASAAGGPSNLFDVITDGDPTEWTATSNKSWITVIDPVDPTTGDEPVTFAVLNNTGAARNGVITISGLNLTFTVNQAAGA
jgi:hypothetical protein